MSNRQVGAHAHGDGASIGRRGYWIRQGRNIVLYPDGAVPQEGEFAFPSRVAQLLQGIPVLTPLPMAPARLTLLSHSHVRRVCLDRRSFTTVAGPPAVMSPSVMNPGFLKADDSIEFDTGLDAKLVDLLVGDRDYKKFLTPESVRGRSPSAGDRIRVALVDLTGDKICKPGYAGWGSTVPMRGASTAKVAIVYAAHQLVFDLNALARARGIGSRADLVKEANAAWTSITCKPDLDWLITVDPSTSPVTVAQSTQLRAHLSGMVSGSDSTRIASELIIRLGFEYIASLLWQSGLRHHSREGLWIGNTFCPGPRDAKTNPACHKDKCPVVWTRNPLSAKGIFLTALSAATFFTLLAQRRLVDEANSTAMETLLRRGCIVRGFSLPSTARIRATKCGVASGFRHDAVLVDHGTVTYVMVYLTKDLPMSDPLRGRLAKDLDRLIRENNP